MRELDRQGQKQASHVLAVRLHSRPRLCAAAERGHEPIKICPAGPTSKAMASMEDVIVRFVEGGNHLGCVSIWAMASE
jgi:hypothetical protein